LIKAEAAALEKYCSLSSEEVLGALASKLDGLSDDEARLRLIRDGPNEIREIRGKPLSLDLQ